MTTPERLPDISAIIRGVLERVEPRLHPLFIAIAERLAAERYRSWARDCLLYTSPSPRD